MTENPWLIIGRYRNGRNEEIDRFATRDEAKAMIAEYRLAYDADWKLCIRFETTHLRRKLDA